MLDLPVGSPPTPVAIAVAAHGPGLCRYALPGLWQLHLYAYACRAEIGGVVCDIRPGSAGLTPPGAAMRYLMPAAGSHTYAHFRAAGGLHQVANMVHLGREFPVAEASLRAAAAWSVADPQRAAVRLWDVLWTVARAGRPGPSGDALVADACAAIEARLGARPGVAALARRLGISHSQLDRRFRASLGTTVVGYARGRRAALAEHLLRSSDLPAIEVAHRIGLADLQALNKLLRRCCGAGPREMRSGRGHSRPQPPAR